MNKQEFDYVIVGSGIAGCSLAHFLSASNETHPNYASFLLDTKRLSINEIKILLEKIPNEDKYEFDKSLIENIYFSYNSSTKGRD